MKEASLLWKNPGNPKVRVKPVYGNTKMGYLFMLPFLVLFGVFVLLPVVVAFCLSFTNYNMMESPSFVGLSHYRLLIMEDKEFLIALKNTFVFAFVSGPVSFLASFLMAWLINGLKKWRNIFSLAFYAPSICSGVAISTVWMTFFSSDSYGYINNALLQLGLITQPIQWTLDARYILYVVIFISVWMGMGTGFLTFLAGLQNLSAELYEAGMIDGVKNQVQELIYITLPQMKPQLLFGAINAAVGAFGVFDIAVAVAGMPSPNYAAHTIVSHLYDFAFIRFEMGYASAVAMFLFLITFTLGQIFMRVFSTKE